MTTPAITVRPLTHAETGGAAVVLGRAMRDNPLHVRAFGDDGGHRERALTNLFSSTLPRQLASGGTILGAFDDESHQLVGVTAFVGPGHCQPSRAAKFRTARTLLGALGPGAIWRMLVWAQQWSRRDPETGHWHLGPVGVDRHLQGRGIGTALLTEFAARMDALGATSYLETDKRGNVPFYERFGFQVVTDADVLGVRNWFMIRTAWPALA
ncbi:MAG: GNAT family N-acetyltransferase [Vicinamibacterales bacterium]